MCLTTSSKPPMAVFLVSILGFVLALLFVLIYLQSHRSEILNPDIKDWNTFYSTLSDLELCVHNTTEISKSSRVSHKTPPPQTVNATEEANITLSIYADVQVRFHGQHIENQVLHGFIDARYLGFKGDPSSLEMTIELTKSIAKNWTACITLSGPAHLLPDSPHKPPSCTASQNSQTLDVVIAQPWIVSEWCTGGDSGSLTVAPQHELNVYLPEGDVTLIQVHILYMTCLLCVMMMGLLFYYLFGRRCMIRPKTTQIPDKIPLHP
ncbi:transmembrane protein 248-like [Macrobrachium nipponense]|uniref:transmembrane protein 248-like n=1 Tax=Macrobrachium nipponense TaxID=159736 RepID=UPI0030C870C1